MKNAKRATAVFSAVFLALLFLTGCQNVVTPPAGSMANLFAVDSRNGSVYEIDAETASAASSALLSIGQNSTGEIVFSGDTGFIAVGSYNNTAPGLYWFDASSVSPVAAMAGQEKISAQYACVASSTRGYVSSADFNGVYGNAVYPFDPSHPSAGLGAAVTGFQAGFYPQEIVCAGGRIYVADNFNGIVYRLNAEGTAVEASFAVSARGTTGLLAGFFGGKEGVFSASTGGWDDSWNPLPGSIDFIASDAADGSAAAVVLAGCSAGRLAAFDPTHLVATGYSRTFIVDLSGASPSAAEVTCSSASFGSNDVDILDGTNTVYRFSAAGTDAAAISVGKAGEYVSNIGVRK